MRPQDAMVLAGWFERHGSHAVDVVLAGRVFGGRHGESRKQALRYEVRANSMTVRFDQREFLKVDEPSEIVLGKFGQLLIPRAKSATFGWYYYGRPQATSTWCELVYHTKADAVIVMKRLGPIGPEEATEEEIPLLDQPFVELLQLSG
jgi:hypothetical protein